MWEIKGGGIELRSYYITDVHTTWSIAKCKGVDTGGGGGGGGGALGA